MQVVPNMKLLMRDDNEGNSDAIPHQSFSSIHVIRMYSVAGTDGREH